MWPTRCNLLRYFASGIEDFIRSFMSRFCPNGWRLTRRKIGMRIRLAFFTHYIIPLSRKMKTCGVFGTTGNVFEYFATENKKRWIEDGELISVKITTEVKEEVERERRMRMNGSQSDILSILSDGFL
mmetsp:Transcript_10507/g.22653  ORF Transcript_10507/g.22653 Transcript_10507/m.22653 type:complete len:127 (-) Transcript_10507:319-699(-)